MLVVGGLGCAAIGYFLGLPFLGSGLVFMIMYVWSRKNANQPISMFGFVFMGMHLPWVMLAFSVLIGNSPVMNIIGIIVGHLYYFSLTIVPAKYGWNMIRTPEFVHNFFAAGNYGVAYTPAGQAVRVERPGQHRWGGGRVLGDH
jgi:Derlin-2/3